MEDIFTSILGQVQLFSRIFFLSMKYILGGIFLLLGLISLLSLKILGNDWKQANYKDESRLEIVKKIRVISGFSFILIGIGFMFNFFLLLLILILPRDGLLGSLFFVIAENMDVMELSFCFLELRGITRQMQDRAISEGFRQAPAK